MKLLKSIFIIFGFTYVGEVLATFFPIPIPGSIIGLLLLFLSLQFKLIDVEFVDSLGSTLQKYMAFFFVPLVAGLSQQIDVFKASWIDLTVGIILTTVVTYVLVGKISERMSK